MALYNIYHGLNGGFSGAKYDYTRYFDGAGYAELEAYNCAIEDYQSYEGSHGILSEEDIKREYMEDNEIENEEDLTDRDYDTIAERYREEVESWIEFYAIRADEDDSVPEEERDVI